MEIRYAPGGILGKFSSVSCYTAPFSTAAKYGLHNYPQLTASLNLALTISYLCANAETHQPCHMAMFTTVVLSPMKRGRASHNAWSTN